MQQLNPSEISEIIKRRIDQLDVSSEARNVGTVVAVTDGIIRIHGLAEVMYGEMIEFDGGIYGLALNLERDSVGAVILGDYKGVAEGQSCRCTGRILEVHLSVSGISSSGVADVQKLAVRAWHDGVLYHVLVDSEEKAQQVRDLLERAGGTLRMLQPHKESLEEYFVRVTSEQPAVVQAAQPPVLAEKP